MKYPALVANKVKLTENIHAVQSLCESNGVSFCAVTKCFCAHPLLVDVYYAAGVRDFADTRIENLQRIKQKEVTKWLLRAPMLSEAEKAVLSADISLNSEIKTIKELSRHALKNGKRHKVVLMVDMGDLREGVLPADAVFMAGEIFKLQGVELLGIGANFNCFGGVIPSQKNTKALAGIAMEIREKYGISLRIVSGGNSGSMHFLTAQNLPDGINHLRIGESILFGNETSFRGQIDGMHADVFRLDAEIIELKKKPSMPIGERGTNAFGEAVFFEDKGEMLRAIVSCGRQDVDMDKITPRDAQTTILGQSSDHMILDMTHCTKKYEVGDIISFSISYSSLLSLSTSEYVAKICE